MARPKEFERDAALEAAIAICCDHGFEGASTDALLDGMGISRQSLYDTFGDKQRLYLEALQRYVDDNVDSQIAALNAPSSLGVEAVLPAMAPKAAIAGAPGCMGIGAICEFGQSDDEVSALIAASGKRLSTALALRLAEAEAKGETSKDVDPRAAAQVEIEVAGIGAVRINIVLLADHVVVDQACSPRAVRWEPWHFCACQILLQPLQE